jgi:hypothetical protein
VPDGFRQNLGKDFKMTRYPTYNRRPVIRRRELQARVNMAIMLTCSALLGVGIVALSISQ